MPIDLWLYFNRSLPFEDIGWKETYFELSAVTRKSFRASGWFATLVARGIGQPESVIF